MDEIIKKYAKNKIFKAGVRDLLGAPVDAIVNPANSGLSHGSGLAAVISDEAGPRLDEACEKIIASVGKIPTTYAVPTRAGNLPFKGVIHAVGPRMGSGDEQQRIEETLINALLVADKKGWSSVAFPAISTGIFGIPKDICATAFKNAIAAFWDKFPESSVLLVWLCLTTDDYEAFSEIIQ